MAVDYDAVPVMLRLDVGLFEHSSCCEGRAGADGGVFVVGITGLCVWAVAFTGRVRIPAACLVTDVQQVLWLLVLCVCMWGREPAGQRQ